MKYMRPDTHILTGLYPTDRNDPATENTATEYALPDGFSAKAKACWDTSRELPSSSATKASWS